MDKAQKNWFLFQGIQGYLWKLALGIVSVSAIQPVFTKKMNILFGTGYEWGFRFFFLIYFLSPVIFFLVWWLTKSNPGLPQNIREKPKIINIFLITSGGLVLISGLLGLSIVGDSAKKEFMMIPLILFGGALLVSGAYLLQQWNLAYSNKPLQSTLKLGLRQYLGMVALSSVFATLFILNWAGCFNKSSNKEASGRFSQIMKIDQEIIKKRFSLYRLVHNDLKNLQSTFFTIQQERNTDYLLEKLKTGSYTPDTITQESLAALMQAPGLKESLDSINVLSNELYEKRDTNLYDGLQSKCDQLKSHLDTLNTVLSNQNDYSYHQRYHFTYWLEEMGRSSHNTYLVYKELFKTQINKLVKKLNFRGLLILFATLFFFLNLWFYLFIENHRAKAMQESSDDKVKDFPELSMVKNLVLLVVILIFPIFGPPQKENFDFNNPLWGRINAFDDFVYSPTKTEEPPQSGGLRGSKISHEYDVDYIWHETRDTISGGNRGIKNVELAQLLLLLAESTNKEIKKLPDQLRDLAESINKRIPYPPE